MGGPLQSIRKFCYVLAATPARARTTWSGPYWREDADGTRIVACRSCPKFRPAGPSCTVPFGSALRKCVVASVEAHVHASAGEQALEIGFGRFTLGKNLVERAGATWTGVDLSQPRESSPRLGTRTYGHAAELPFPDATFDLVFGIQTLEHWGERSEDASLRPSEYADCLREVRRVLRPGGRLYLDAPVHLHGHEMFIVGDVPRVRALFDPAAWDDVTLEKWRLDHAPLPASVPDPGLRPHWDVQVRSYGPDVVETLGARSQWLLAVTARRRG